MGGDFVKIRYVETGDRKFWYTLDKHLPESEFEEKVRRRQGYILLDGETPVGILRYNLFWDNTPFCTMLYIRDGRRRKGCGRKMMEHWESDMRVRGFGMVMTSTQVDEQAQHFYRKLGYKDSGGFILDIPGYEQAMEMIMVKDIRH